MSDVDIDITPDDEPEPEPDEAPEVATAPTVVQGPTVIMPEAAREEHDHSELEARLSRIEDGLAALVAAAAVEAEAEVAALEDIAEAEAAETASIQEDIEDIVPQDDRRFWEGSASDIGLGE